MSDAAAHVTITLAQSAELSRGEGGEVGSAATLQSERRMMTEEQPTPLAVSSGG
jgi:hypothetical protein